MRSLFCLLVPTFCLSLLSTPPTSNSQTTPRKDSPRLDLSGDPLPDGAIARLGTVRWRHGLVANAVAYGLGGKVIVSIGSLGFAVGIWDAATGKPLHKVRGPELGISLAVSPDGKLAVTSYLGVIDLASGQELRRLGPLPNTLYCMAFSADGQTVAGGDILGQGGAKIILWDVNTGKELRILRGHSDGVLSIAFSPDGKVLASVSVDKTCRLWDVATGKELKRRDLDGEVVGKWVDENGKFVDWVGFSPDGKVLAFAGMGGAARLWDVASGKLVRRLETDEGAILQTAFSPDGQMIALAGASKQIRLVDAVTGKQIRRWPADATGSLVFSPDGKTLTGVGITRHTVIQRWDVATGKELDPPSGHTGAVHALSFTADGKKLVSRGEQNEVLEWDLKNLGTHRKLFDVSALAAKEHWLWKIIDHSLPGEIVVVRGHPAGADILNVKEDPRIKIWSTATGKELKVFDGNKNWPNSGKLSPNGKFLASREKDGIRLWEVGTGKQLHHFRGKFPTSTFSSGSTLLAYAGDDKTIHIIDIATGKEVGRLENPEQRRIGVIGFAPDGKMLVSADNDALRLWSTNTGKEIKRIGRSTSAYLSIPVFSPSSRVVACADEKDQPLASGGNQLTWAVRLFEVITGDEIRRIPVPHAMVKALAFSPDGRTLASGCGDSTILFWDLTGQAGNAKATPITAKQMETYWADLAADAPKADKAIWALALAPADSMPSLKKFIRPPEPADVAEVGKLVAALASDGFAVRQRALQDLEKLGESAEAQVRKHLEGNLPLEVRQRLQEFLKNRDKDAVRKIRAIEVLEQINTSESRGVLQSLAKDAPNSRVSEAATAALARLGKQRGN